jgi:hypothetical protein
MEPPRESLRQVLRRGIERGQLPENLDMETAVALLLGPMLYSHIFGRDGMQVPPPEFGAHVAESFWRAHSQARKERINEVLGGYNAAGKKKARKG